MLLKPLDDLRAGGGTARAGGRRRLGVELGDLPVALRIVVAGVDDDLAAQGSTGTSRTFLSGTVTTTRSPARAASAIAARARAGISSTRSAASRARGCC